MLLTLSISWSVISVILILNVRISILLICWLLRRKRDISIETCVILIMLGSKSLLILDAIIVMRKSEVLDSTSTAWDVTLPLIFKNDLTWILFSWVVVIKSSYLSRLISMSRAGTPTSVISTIRRSVNLLEVLMSLLTEMTSISPRLWSNNSICALVLRVECSQRLIGLWHVRRCCSLLIINRAKIELWMLSCCSLLTASSCLWVISWWT